MFLLAWVARVEPQAYYWNKLLGQSLVYGINTKQGTRPPYCVAAVDPTDGNK